MAKILLNNPVPNSDNTTDPVKNTPVDEVKKETTNTVTPASKVAPVTKVTTPTVTTPANAEDDDWAIFPEWDVVPPNSIINPRIKRKL